MRNLIMRPEAFSSALRRSEALSGRLSVYWQYALKRSQAFSSALRRSQDAYRFIGNTL